MDVATAHAQRDRTLPGWEAGAGMAGLAAMASLTPSLYPRTHGQQGIVTGISVAAAFGLGAGVNAVANTIDRHSRLDAVQSRLAIAGTAGLGMLATTLLMHGHPVPGLQAARTGAAVVGGAALVSLGLVGEQAAADRLAPHVPGGAATAHVALLGAAALGTAAMLFGPARSSAVSREAEAAFIQSRTDGIPDVSKIAFDQARHDELVGLRAGMSTVSGTGAATKLPRATLNPAGIRFLDEVMPRQEIDRVMGVAAGTAKDPVRVFGGFRQGASVAERADNMYQEALRLGAFDRGRIVLVAPTGSGYIYPETVSSLEHLTLGDVATVAMQWNDQPSRKSFHMVPEGQQLFDAVMRKFADHIATMPAASRPKLAIYGESLGGDALKDMFTATGAAGITARGVDTMLTLGNARASSFRMANLGAEGQRLDATGMVFEYSHPKELAALTDAQRDGIVAHLLSHHDDPLGKVNTSLLYTRGDWLRDERFATGVPRKMHWFPGITGIQGLFDMLNGANLTAGDFSRIGHDYKADMAAEVANVFRLPHTDAQLAAVQLSAVQQELTRKFVPLAGEV